MFTGIIHNQAVVAEKKDAARSTRFEFRFAKPEKKIETGESIAVNGVCLTVIKGESKGFQVDVVGQTLKSTTLGQLRKGAQVNIERALRAGQSLGGHFVTGHVDGRGQVLRIRQKAKDRLYFIRVPKEIRPYMARKGSVTLDGISLTIQEASEGVILITIIPHTLKVTTLGRLKEGDEVNIEADILARYLDGMLSQFRQGSRPKAEIKALAFQGF
jgi:riboflavin synthase